MMLSQELRLNKTMKSLPTYLLVASVALSSCAVSNVSFAAETPAAPKTVRLFTVGNSFSQNATKYLADIATAAGDKLVQGRAVIGGSSPEVHWTKIQKNEKDPRDPAGLYSTKLGLKTMLAADKWDYVTIQQASIKSHDLATYRPHAKLLHDYIREQCPNAKVIVHQTWAYRRDDPRFLKPPTKPGEPKTQAEMYEGLANAYRTIAAELGCDVIPVGDAFYLADTDPEWGYKADTKFDVKTAKPRALPDQTHSLHVGWYWPAAGKNQVLSIDGHHANTAGEYLGACVFYETLFEKSVVDNTFVPKGLSEADAKYLRNVAHRAVEQERERRKKQ